MFILLRTLAVLCTVAEMIIWVLIDNSLLILRIPLELISIVAMLPIRGINEVFEEAFVVIWFVADASEFLVIAALGCGQFVLITTALV